MSIPATDPARVAVIGAGITGTLVARELASAGMDVVVLDRRDAEERPHRPVEGARGSAALYVAEDRRPRLRPEPLLEELPDPLGLDGTALAVDSR